MLFDELADCFGRLAESKSRLRMYAILGELFERASAAEIEQIAWLCEGRVLPAFSGVEIGLGQQLLIRAIASAASRNPAEVRGLYKKLGDSGLAAERFLPTRKASKLSVSAAYKCLLKIARTSGAGSIERKIELLKSLLKQGSGRSACWVVRLAGGELRLGVGPVTMIEAFARRFPQPGHARKTLERAWNLCSDLGLVLKTARSGGIEALERFKVRPGHPVRSMLAERLPGAEEILARLGTCAVESKLDGFRCQLHMRKGELEIYSRNQERTTEMFPDLSQSARRQLGASTLILDGEAIAMNESTGELFPFQVTVQRKRKHLVADMAREFPLALFVFDVLYAGGKDLTERPYEERRKALEKLLRRAGRLRPEDQIIAHTPVELKNFFDSQIEKGLEGIVAKRLDAPYEAGARNFNWIKLKKTYQGHLSDTVDVVIVGYFRGRGGRARLGIGAILVSVYDQSADKFPTIAKVGSGFSEKDWVKLRQTLDEIRSKERPPAVQSRLTPDVWVMPKYVIPVLADQITRSPVHLCAVDKEGRGLALRFPRAAGGIRADKSAEDATSVPEVRRMFARQT